MTAHGARPGRAPAGAADRPQAADRCAHDRAGEPDAAPAAAGHVPEADGRLDRPGAADAWDRTRAASPRAWLAGADPAGKLLAAVLVGAGLIPVVDPVTSGTVLVAGLALVPFSGLDRVRLL